MHRDLLCEAHRREISRLGYCENHRKLVDSKDMCEDCLPSEVEGSLKNFAVFPWVKGFGVMQKGAETVGEKCRVSLNCSCCGVCLDNGAKYSSYILLKTSSWDVLECAQKENLITEACDFDVDDDSNEKILDSSEKVEIDGNLEGDENDAKFEGDEAKSLEAGEDEVDVMMEVERERGNVEEERSILIMKDKSVQVCVEENEIPPQQHLEFFLDYSGHTLVPIELVDSMIEGEENDKFEGDDATNKDQDYHSHDLDSQVRVEEREALVLERESRVEKVEEREALLLERERREEEKVEAFLDVDINEEPTYTMLDVMEMEEDENSLVFHAKDSHFETFPLARWPSVEVNDDQETAGAPVEEQSDGRAGKLIAFCFAFWNYFAKKLYDILGV